MPGGWCRRLTASRWLPTGGGGIAGRAPRFRGGRGLWERCPRRRLGIADRGLRAVEPLAAREALTRAAGRAVADLGAVPGRRSQRRGAAGVALPPERLAASRARRGAVGRATPPAAGRRLGVAPSPPLAPRRRRLRAKRLRHGRHLAWALAHPREAPDRGEPGRGRPLTATGAPVQLHPALAAPRVRPLLTGPLDEPG